MPRKPTVGPGPKSKVQKSKRTSFLGDSSVSEAEASESGSFQSVEPEGDQTDYGFDYTNTPLRGRSLRSTSQPSTSKEPSGSKSIPAAKTGRQEPRLHPATKTPERRTFLPQQNNTQSPAQPSQKKRKQVNPRRREQLMWKQIRQLQSRTDNLMPKAPFGRLIREILTQSSREAERITLKALEALQVSSEIYLTHLFSDAYVCTLHRGRVTLGVHDLRLVRFLRGPTDTGNVQ